MKHSEIIKLLKFSHSLGAKRLKIGDFEVEFTPNALVGTPAQPVQLSKSIPDLKHGETIFPMVEGLPTEDELLMWSVDQYEDVKEPTEGLK